MTKAEWEIKKLLLQYDEVDLPMDAQFYDQLHDKILARVDDASLDTANRIHRMRSTLQAHWKSWFYASADKQINKNANGWEE